MTITDEMLYEAADGAAERFLDTLPGRAECGHVFSPAFERRMAPLLGRRRRKPWRALLVLAAVLAALAAGLTVGAERQPDCQLYWSQSDGELRYAVRVEHETAQTFRAVELGYLPDGYLLTHSSVDNGQTYSASYGDGENTFSVEQQSGGECSGLMLGDYRGTETEVGSRAALLAEEAETGRRMLLWTDGPYILKLSGRGISGGELLRIAEQIKW